MTKLEMQVETTLNDDEAAEIDSNWDKASPEQKLAWYNHMAQRSGIRQAYSQELLELANHFARQQRGAETDVLDDDGEIVGEITEEFLGKCKLKQPLIKPDSLRDAGVGVDGMRQIIAERAQQADEWPTDAPPQPAPDVVERAKACEEAGVTIEQVADYMRQFQTPPAPDVVELAYAAFVAQLKKEGWTNCDPPYIPSEKKAIAAAISALPQRPVDVEGAVEMLLDLPLDEGGNGLNQFLSKPWHEAIKLRRLEYFKVVYAIAMSWGLTPTPTPTTSKQGGGE